MASLRVLAFDHEGRPIQFDTWLDDLQLYLLSDSKDSVSLFDLAPGAATAPPATADNATRSQWLTRDAAARLAVCNHLPLAECAHFGQHRTAQALYAAVDLVSPLRTSDTRYHATVPAEFLDKNQPPMFITLYFIVTRLPDSLRSAKDHFLSLDPTSLTVDLLEQHLLATETSAVAVGAARGTPRPPFFEGCSPSTLAPSYASAAAADVSVAEDVGAASASAKRRSSKGKGGRGGGGGSGSGGGGSSVSNSYAIVFVGCSGLDNMGWTLCGLPRPGIPLLFHHSVAEQFPLQDPPVFRVSVPETSPTLRWTGKVGDASVFRVWGSRAFVRDLSADKLSPRAVPCVFLGFPPDAPGWQFYHPTSRRVLSSQDVTFDKSVDAIEPVEVAVDSGAGSGGAELGGADSKGAEPGGAEPGSAEPGGAEPGGAGSARVASRSASSRRELLSPQELSKWFARRWSRAAGARGTTVATGPGGARTGGTGAAGTGGAAAAAGVGPAGASGAAGAGAAGGVGAGVGPAGGTAGAAGGTGAAGPAGVGAAGASGATSAGAAGGVSVGGSPDAGPSAGTGVGAVGAGGAAGAGAATGGPGAVPGGSGDPARPRPYFIPLLEQGVDYFQTFSPTPKMTTLRVLLHVAAQRDYELHSLDFSTAFLQGSLHEEIWLRRLPGFTGSFPPGTQWSLRRPVYGLRQAPREWHDTLRTTLAALGFAPSTADPSLFLRADTSLPPFYVLMYVDDLVFATADTAGLAHVKFELQKRHTCTDLGELRSYLGLQITRDRAQRTITRTQSHMVQQVLQGFDFTYSSPQATPLSTRLSLSALPSDESVEPSGPYPELVGCLMLRSGSSQGYTFSLGSGSVSWRSTRSSSVLGSSCEAEIYAGAMAAQELRWLTYLLTDLGEQPRSPPVLYVDNKAMLALCREHRLEHRTKHIALRYFLAHELQQRGQLRLAYVASQANTADIFTKALPPGDHQRFCTMLVMVVEAVEVVAAVGLVAGVGSLVAVVEAAVGVAAVEAVGLEAVGLALGMEALRGTPGGSDTCPYVIRTSVRAGQTCGKLHTQHRCFSRLDDTWRAEFGDDVELPRWADLLRSRIAIFDLDFDAILSAMYALSVSAEGDCYRCVTPDPGIAAAALGDSESGTLPGTAPAQALHTFTLDSGASRCFFCDSTTLTPLPAPVPNRLTDPSGGPIVARSSTVLPCSAVPFGSLSGLHLPSFSTNLVSTAALQDAMVTTTTPGGRRVSIWTCTRTRRHLPTFTRGPGSSLYTLSTEPPQVAASAHVSASGQVAASCSCRLLLHQTLLWHHRLGHPSLPRLRGMHSRLLVSGLPRSRPPLPPSPAPPCLPCVEGRQRTAPHSSSFPPTTAPLQTLHMDVKGQVVDVLIPWIRTVCLQLREQFGQDQPVLRLHSERGGEFSSNLLRDFCRGEGILQSFTLPDSPQQNGIAERRIGLVMEVSCTSMIHAAAPHFLWPFVVRYAAHQLNLWPRVSLPETSPTLRLTREVGDASVFRVWGSRAFVRDTSADKLFARAILCVFLGFFPDAPGWQFYHPTSRRVLPSQDVDPLPGTASFEVSVGSGATPGAASGGAASGGAEPGGAGSEGGGSGGAEPGGEEPWGAEPEGVEPGGAESEGAESGGAEPQGAALSGGPAGASPQLSPQQLREWLVWRARLRSGAPGVGGAGDAGAGGAGFTAGASGTGGTAAAGPGGARTRGAGAARTGGVGVAGAGDPTEPGPARAGGSCAGGAGAGGAGARGAGVGGTGAGGAGAAGAGAVDPGARGAGVTVRPPLYFVPLIQQPASPLPVPSPYTEQSGGLTERRKHASHPILPLHTGRPVPRSRPPPVPGTHAMALRPSSVPLRVPLPAPPESSHPEVPNSKPDRARAASPTVSHLLAIVVTDHSFESAAASTLVAELLDFAAACRLDNATALVAESASTSPPSVRGDCALGTDVLEDRQEDFECLAASVPHFASMLRAPEEDLDAPDIPTPRSYEEAITGPYSSQWQAAMDAEMASWKSTGTYVDEVPPPGANIVDGMLIFTVKRPPGSPPAFKARYVARGFDTQWSLRRPVYGIRQAPREWHDTLRTTLAALGFAPATADPSLFLRTDTWLSPFYVLVYVNDLVFATSDTEALTHVKSELQKRHSCTDLGELRSYLGLQITRDKARRTITLTQSHMVHQVLQRFGFQFSSPQPTPLSTIHSLSAPPSDESVEPSGPYREFVGCLMYLMTCTRPDLTYPLSLLAPYVAPNRHRKVHWDAGKSVLRYLCSTSGMGLVLGGRGLVVLTGHADASWVDDSAMQRSSQSYTFSLGSGSVSWRSTRSSSVLSSSCEPEIYVGAMAAQELRWLTYLRTDLGEQPRSPPFMYVDNKAMIALCQEHRLEHRTKHIALRYFLARELQQRGQLHLAYVATRANNADIFTKALPPDDHQRFSNVLGLVPTLPHLLTA
ncbi:unnamed protein product [Closterium sp. NIES-54]